MKLDISIPPKGYRRFKVTRSDYVDGTRFLHLRLWIVHFQLYLPAPEKRADADGAKEIRNQVPGEKPAA